MVEERLPRLSANRSFTTLLLIAAALTASPQAFAQGPLQVYYVRHAESGHNIVKEWKLIPKAKWPAYVGNEDAFTPKGEEQVAALTQTLKSLKIDFIAVSPLWRTRHTVLPYLKDSGQKAELWPELAETPHIQTWWTAPDIILPRPNPKLFVSEIAVNLPESEQPFFVFRDDARHLLSVGDKDELHTAANCVAAAQRVVELIKTRFGKSGKTILLVGHGNSGSTLLRVLTTTKTIKPALLNTSTWMAEEQPDGSFKLKTLNDQPYRD